MYIYTCILIYIYTYIYININVLEYLRPRVHQATILAVDADGDHMFINN